MAEPGPARTTKDASGRSGVVESSEAVDRALRSPVPLCDRSPPTRPPAPHPTWLPSAPGTRRPTWLSPMPSIPAPSGWPQPPPDAARAACAGQRSVGRQGPGRSGCRGCRSCTPWPRPIPGPHASAGAPAGPSPPSGARWAFGPFFLQFPGSLVNPRPHSPLQEAVLRAIPPSSAGRAVARFRSCPGKLPD